MLGITKGFLITSFLIMGCSQIQKDKPPIQFLKIEYMDFETETFVDVMCSNLYQHNIQKIVINDSFALVPLKKALDSFIPIEQISIDVRGVMIWKYEDRIDSICFSSNGEFEINGKNFKNDSLFTKILQIINPK